jgi:hypothetical protein
MIRKGKKIKEKRNKRNIKMKRIIKNHIKQKKYKYK